MRFKWIEIVFAIILAVLISFGCSPFVPVIDLSKIPAETLQKSFNVKTFEASSKVKHPKVKEFLGKITAFSCQYDWWDPYASEDNALAQLKLKAMERGADGIIDVKYNFSGASLSANCWSMVRATGIAVKFKHKEQ